MGHAELAAFLKRLTTERRLSPHTVEAYERDLKALLTFCEREEIASFKALDSFGRANYETTALYITWALSEAGRSKGLDKELAFSRKLGLESKDPYLVALAANTMLNVDPSGAETRKIVTRMVELQDKAGHFPGAAQSITMSGGLSLDVESTALATFAMVKASPNGE